jgi:hypothetical protein
MPELSEYEITEPNGVVTRLQLTDDDAKKFPHAKKVGTVHAEKTDASEDDATDTGKPAGTTHQHEQVQNRARRAE